MNAQTGNTSHIKTNLAVFDGTAGTFKYQAGQNAGQTVVVTINAMTLAGLALAIGPLVDDAIVELENNHRNFSLTAFQPRL